MFVLHRRGADVAEARVEDYNLRYRLRENDPIYLDFKKEIQISKEAMKSCR